MKAILTHGAAVSVLLYLYLFAEAPASVAPRQARASASVASSGRATLAPVGTCDPSADYGDANGIALDARGDIYTAMGDRLPGSGEAVGVEIRKWSATGRLLATWMTPGMRRDAAHHPADVAVDVHGDIYVSDTNAGHIIKLSATGRVLAIWGAPGTAAGQFGRPAGIAVDRRGAVYVADKGNGRVQVLDAMGRPRAVWRLPSPRPGQASLPSGLAVDERGRVYVADDAIRILVLSPDGATLRAWGSKGSQPDQFRHPVGIALDPQGHLDIADKLNARIQQFSVTGTPLRRWTTGASATGWFNAQGLAPAQPAFPTGVAVTTRGTIYTLAGWCTSRIQAFVPDGRTMAIWSVK